MCTNTSFIQIHTTALRNWQQICFPNLCKQFRAALAGRSSQKKTFYFFKAPDTYIKYVVRMTYCRNMNTAKQLFSGSDSNSVVKCVWGEWKLCLPKLKTHEQSGGINIDAKQFFFLSFLPSFQLLWQLFCNFQFQFRHPEGLIRKNTSLLSPVYFCKLYTKLFTKFLFYFGCTFVYFWYTFVYFVNTKVPLFRIYKSIQGNFKIYNF